MTIGERIKQSRLTSGKTLEEVGLLIGTSRQTLFKYESGIITNIPSDKIERLAVVLNCTPAYLMILTSRING